MERFDILDDNGNPTGLTKEKGEPLGPGEYYLGVHAYIYNENKNFLIQRRALDKDFRAGCWDIHLGHAIAGESSAMAVNRELFEEVGIRVGITQADRIGRILWKSNQHFADFYLKETAIGRIELQIEEVIGVKLISLDAMIKMTDGMRAYRPAEYVETVLQALKGLRA